MMMAAAGWAERKAAARAARKDDGYRMETSFTSDQPMHGWVVEHAIRELWQNLRDGVVAALGADQRFSVEFKGTNNQYVTLSTPAGPGGAAPEIVAFVNATLPNKLILWQKYAVLEPKHLQLASHKRGTNQAGGHGEGFKVAINYLLRRGYRVRYDMDGQSWFFTHEALHDSTGSCKNMVVTMRHADDNPGDALTITVEGPGAEKLFNPRIDWDLFRSSRNKGLHRDAAPGVTAGLLEIVQVPEPDTLTNAGRVYNRSLYVSDSPELKHLRLAVNLDLDLHRDRHALPSNVFAKLAEAMDTTHEAWRARPPTMLRYVGLCEHILKAFGAATGQKLGPVADALRDPLRDYCAVRYNVPASSIHFLAGSGEDVMPLLQRLGHEGVQNSGALADSVDVRGLVLDEMASSPVFQPKDPGQVQRLAWLSEFTTALGNISGETISLKVRSCPRLTEMVVLRYVTSLEMTSDYLTCTDGSVNWLGAALRIYAEVTKYKRLVPHSSMERAYDAFVTDPAAFKADKYTKPTAVGVMAGAGAAAGGAGQSNSWSPRDADGSNAGAGGGASTTAGQPTRQQQQRQHVPFNAMTGDSSRPQLLNMPPPRPGGRPDTSLPGTPAEHAADTCVTCGVPKAELVPILLAGAGGRTVEVYVEESIWTSAEFLEESPVFTSLLPTFDEAVSRLLDQVHATLGLSFRVPVVYTVCHNALGFNYKGHVYLNMWRIMDARPGPAALARGGGPVLEGLLLTILHELAHFSVQPHNEDFARELCRLTWACRHIAV